VTIVSINPSALPQRGRRCPPRENSTTPSSPSIADKDASVAVFTGTGGYFCAGADLKAVASGDPNKKREIGGHDSIAPMGPSRLRLSKTRDRRGRRLCGWPVAWSLSLWADMRVVAEDATSACSAAALACR